MGKCSYVKAELKYQGARFARKWNVRRFSGLRRKNGWRATKRKCVVKKEVISLETTRWQVRMAGNDDIVRCFQADIPVLDGKW